MLRAGGWACGAGRFAHQGNLGRGQGVGLAHEVAARTLRGAGFRHKKEFGLQARAGLIREHQHEQILTSRPAGRDLVPTVADVHQRSQSGMVGDDLRQ